MFRKLATLRTHKNSFQWSTTGKSSYAGRRKIGKWRELK